MAAPVATSSALLACCGAADQAVSLNTLWSHAGHDTCDDEPASSPQLSVPGQWGRMKLNATFMDSMQHTRLPRLDTCSSIRSQPVSQQDIVLPAGLPLDESTLQAEIGLLFIAGFETSGELGPQIDIPRCGCAEAEKPA